MVSILRKTSMTQVASTALLDFYRATRGYISNDKTLQIRKVHFTINAVTESLDVCRHGLQG
jgi:hypothetical protein